MPDNHLDVSAICGSEADSAGVQFVQCFCRITVCEVKHTRLQVDARIALQPLVDTLRHLNRPQGLVIISRAR